MLKIVLVALLLGTAAAAGAAGREIGWADLEVTGKAAPRAQVDGEDVTISGFIVPVDREGDVVYEFLLVPWVGACSHAAQPQPSQVIRVTPAAPYRASGSYEPVAVSGRMKVGTEATQLFIMDGVVTVRSAYAIGNADVRGLGGQGAKPVEANPWRSLQR